METASKARFRLKGPSTADGRELRFPQVSIVSQRVVYEAYFSDGWVVPGQAITADSLAG
jgi:hypothetical protein